MPHATPRPPMPKCRKYQHDEIAIADHNILKPHHVHIRAIDDIDTPSISEIDVNTHENANTTIGILSSYPLPYIDKMNTDNTLTRQAKINAVPPLTNILA